jgi:hypothetical protein
MHLFHVTTPERAEAILREGFKDGFGRYMTDQTFSGVWLSDRPLDANDGVNGEATLGVSFQCQLRELDCYEWVEEGKSYREWLIPAQVIAEKATTSILEGSPLRL